MQEWLKVRPPHRTAAVQNLATIYLVLPDLPGVSRLFCSLVVPLPPLIVLLIFLIFWDWLLLSARSLRIGTCPDSGQGACQHRICETVSTNVRVSGTCSTYGHIIYM
jgi:hypothetical protein